MKSKLFLLGDVILRVPQVIAFAVPFVLAGGLNIMLGSTDLAAGSVPCIRMPMRRG
ncbi:hypothetical protein [Bradyrhizobium sp.]|jgi:branched-chain amino acid transport system permease protein|uniref:hypothetical protein n=1 Tax=Bradyrhizobium sp. TaxID=376 RepID=UPI000AA896AF|nr:hypothetical protein [Bradyrhizobium sp.]